MKSIVRRLIPISIAFALGLASGAYGFGGGAEQPSGSSSPRTESTAQARAPSSLDDLRALLEASEQQRQRIESELFGLEERVVALEEAWRSADAQSAGVGSAEAQSALPTDGTVKAEGLTEASLIAAGIGPELAASIVRRQAMVEMDRLELRDEAIRDDWFGSQRYFEALAEINTDSVALREELGEEAYDRYLYASGEDNRIVVTSVIAGSPADQAGVRSGDILLSYAGQELFSSEELRTQTTEGQRDEPITIRVRRGSSEVDLLLPRGPMGVRLDSTRVKPRG